MCARGPPSSFSPYFPAFSHSSRAPSVIGPRPGFFLSGSSSLLRLSSGLSSVPVHSLWQCSPRFSPDILPHFLHYSRSFFFPPSSPLVLLSSTDFHRKPGVRVNQQTEPTPPRLLVNPVIEGTLHSRPDCVRMSYQQGIRVRECSVPDRDIPKPSSVLFSYLIGGANSPYNYLAGRSNLSR